MERNPNLQPLARIDNRIVVHPSQLSSKNEQKIDSYTHMNESPKPHISNTYRSPTVWEFKQTLKLKKQAKEIDRKFTEQEMQTVLDPMNRYSAWFIIWEIQIKITPRHSHLTNWKSSLQRALWLMLWRNWHSLMSLVGSQFLGKGSEATCRTVLCAFTPWGPIDLTSRTVPKDTQEKISKEECKRDR